MAAAVEEGTRRSEADRVRQRQREIEADIYLIWSNLAIDVC